MAQNSTFNQSNHLYNINEKSDKQECKTTDEIYETSTEEAECNLQTPLMFSRCSSLGSLTGFEQHSIQDDRNSIISEFSPKTSRGASPPLSQNQTSEISCKLYSPQKPNNNAEEKILCNNAFVEEKVNPCERMSIPTNNVSFQYDIAFKKPHFLKHSVFEDDIAAFKDESSPNLLSTAASSLSSLTIDDDEYSDISQPNKAALVKKRVNSTSVLQNTHYQEHLQHDSASSTCGSELAKTSVKRVVNQLNYKSMIQSDKSFAQRNFNYEEPKIAWNLKNNQYSKNLQDKSFKKDFKERSDLMKSESQCQVSEKNKYINILQDNDERFMHHKIEPDSECNSKHSKDNIFEKYKNEKQDFKERIKVFEDCCKSSKEQSNFIEENNDLNAYEEQLLDQCIRRGMAKVTKQNITDIKPFCWDLNHICLTTRAMLKTRDDEIIRDRKDERSNRRISQKCLPIRYTTISRTK